MEEELQNQTQNQPHNQTKRERQRERRREKELLLDALRRKQKSRRRIYIFSGLGLIAVALFVIVLIAQRSGDDSSEIVTTDTEIPTTTTETTTTTEPGDIITPNFATFTETDYGTGECPPAGAAPKLSFDDSPALCLDPAQEYEAVFNTSEGVIKVRLDTANTPGTANNFYVLSKYGYYDGTLLFRTDPSIGIIQGGAPHNNSPSDPGPGYTIKDEGTEFGYVPGQLVMARTGAPNSSGAQFFFAVNENTSLLDGQGTYVVFGETTEGLDVLEAILGLHVDDPASALGGGPSREVRIESLEINPVG